MRYVIAILAFFLAFSATAANKKKTRSRTRTQKQAQVRSKSKSKSKKAKPKVTAKAKPKPKPKVEPTPITFEQIDYYIKRFATQGLHRAGSKIDKRTARVLENFLKKDGLKVTMESFTFRRPVSGGGMVSMKIDKINSRIMPGMPYLSSPSTGGTNRRAPLGFVGEDGKIPVIHIYVTPASANAKLRATSLKRFKDAVASGRYPAVIGVTQGGYSGLIPLMIDLSKKYKTPAILLSSALGNFVEIYAEINNPVTYRTTIRYENSKAYNLIATIEGSDPKLKPLVILTSRSSWWSAAAERGTGIAAWLAVAKRMSQVQPRRTLLFVSTTGQEFFSLGLKKFLAAHPELVNNAYGWIYIGANVGTKPVPHFVIQGSSRRMRRLVYRAFEDNNLEHIRWAEGKNALIPPLNQAYQNTDHSLIIAATNNKCFRMTCDKWPSNVNIEVTLSFAKALVQIVQELSN